MWLYSTDVCYAKNDAYDVADHDEQHCSYVEDTSDDKEAKKVIYGEVSKQFRIIKLQSFCINWSLFLVFFKILTLSNIRLTAALTCVFGKFVIVSTCIHACIYLVSLSSN